MYAAGFFASLVFLPHVVTIDLVHIFVRSIRDAHVPCTWLGVSVCFSVRVQICVLFFELYDLDPFTCDHIMNIFCHLTGMVTGSFEIPGHHDVICAAGDGLWVLHHEGKHLT
jgi:hypothetical protein